MPAIAVGSPDVFSGRRCALFIGHPGHELRVWGWMRATAPLVAILTDGSGRDASSRLDLSRATCSKASATASRCFGLATDEAVYDAILRRDTRFFLAAADALADVLREHAIECVVGDADEGYNPTHDLCRLLIDRAVRLVAATQPVGNYAFNLVRQVYPTAPSAVRVDLTPGELTRKLEEARAYAVAAGGTLLGEIETMLQEDGPSAFAAEYFVRVDPHARVESPPDYQPFYETYGERQVALGRYARVIRYHEHIGPLALALRED